MDFESKWKLDQEKFVIEEEVAQILGLARKTYLRDYVFFSVGTNTGIRISEVVHLQTDDLNRDQLRVTRRKKKKLSPEMIDLPDGFPEILGGWIKKQKPGWLFPGQCSPCIIKRKTGRKERICDGGHVSTREMERRWKAYLTKLKLYVPGRGPHQLRHFAVTKFYELHKDLRATQKYVDHSSSRLTEKYAHVHDLKGKIKKLKATV